MPRAWIGIVTTALVAGCFVQREPPEPRTRCGSGSCAAGEICVSYSGPPFNECAAPCAPGTRCADGCPCLALTDGTAACADACIAWRTCLDKCESLDMPWGCQPAVAGSCDKLYQRMACQLRCDERFHCARCGGPSDRCAAAGYVRCECPAEHGGFPCHHPASFGACRGSPQLAQALAGHASAYQGAVAAVREPDGTIRLAAHGSAGGKAVSFDDQFRIASLTKSFTAALVLLLVQDGLLSLDDSAASFGLALPSQIQVKHLLRHESGLRDYLNVLEATDRLYAPHTPAQLLALVANQPLDHPRYSNTNYIALGMIIERVTGRSYESMLASRLLKPLGLDRTSLEGYLVGAAPVPGVIETDAGYVSGAGRVHPSNAWSAGGMVSTADDMARWLDALLLRRSVLSPAQFDELVKPNASGYACGLVLDLSKVAGRLAHDGSDPRGASVFMAADRATGRAALVLTNTYGLRARAAAMSITRSTLGW